MSIKVELSNSPLVALLDERDGDLAALPWRLTSGGYAIRYAGGGRQARRTERMHRVVLARVLGRRTLEVDHISGDRLDNRRANLREATPSLNHANRGKPRGSYTSRYKGVRRVARLKARPWEANITVRQRTVFLGLFATEESAADAYDEAAVRYFGAFARTNGHR